MKDLILFGMQGSGKGTQGKLIAEKFPYQIFEAGAELRKLSAEGSPLGKKVKGIIDAGNLVPDEVIMEIVEAYVNRMSALQAIIFDGIPRNGSQSRLFTVLMKRVKRDPWGLYIRLTEVEALRRLTSRRICSNCKKVFSASYSGTVCDNCGGTLVKRADDTPESINVRLANFHSETMPVIESYRAIGRLIEVDGDTTMEKVSAEILRKLS